MPPGREAAPRKPVVVVPPAPPGTGRGMILASFVGTGLLTVTTAMAIVAPSTLDAPALFVALVMFFGGTAAFIWAYLVAIGRSREREISLTGVYGLAGSAPRFVQVRLLGSLAAEVVVALVGAAARPYTSLSFGILAPMWGLGVAGLWGARYGAFPPRAPDRRRRRSGSGAGG